MFSYLIILTERITGRLRKNPITGILRIKANAMGIKSLELILIIILYAI